MNVNDYLCSENEKPLDRICRDGGFTSIFRTICCVGDSLSSGEFEATAADGGTLYLDMFEYSWGQFIGRMCGSTVYNFSRGGMTASEYCSGWAEGMDFWNPKYASQAYIIALGVNDILNMSQPVGTMDDICDEDWHKNSTETFAGWYGQLIQRLREIRPDAKFFLMTMCRGSWVGDREAKIDAHAELLYKMAEHFPNTYVLDIRKYGPVHDEAFCKAFYMGGHLNPMGYRFTAEEVTSYIDYIIRKNPEDFKQVAFIGTPYKKL